MLVSRLEFLSKGKKIAYLLQVLVTLDVGYAEGSPPLPRPGGVSGRALDNSELVYAKKFFVAVTLDNDVSEELDLRPRDSIPFTLGVVVLLILSRIALTPSVPIWPPHDSPQPGHVHATQQPSGSTLRGC